MAGRNSKPDNDGPASSPSRLDQFVNEDNVDEERMETYPDVEIESESLTDDES